MDFDAFFTIIWSMSSGRTTTDTKKRQAMNNLAAPRPPPQLPQKVSRVRSNSTSMTSPPSITRKRTSSGVFQVDESEPLPKKLEVSPTLPISPRKRPEDVSNGRQKKTENEESGKQGKETLEKTTERLEKKKGIVDKNKGKVIEKFDSKAKSKCVSAFKESDSWD